MPCTWCGPSCGERYWGDFYSDPPDCWDPCDCHGNFTGGGCHSCRNGHGGGYSRDDMGDGYVDEGMPVSDGNVISQNDRVVGQTSNGATQPHRAMKQPTE